jgi:putative DeoR family transcriptional regulator (stage III sporulation protein D)
MTKVQQIRENRILEEGKFIINSESTIRKTAKLFGVSKSTIHKDLTQKLPEINYGLALAVRNVLDENFSEKHIRGGISTHNKYKNN